MHHSRLCAVLIDCKTDDVEPLRRPFWAEALGRPVDPGHQGRVETTGCWRRRPTNRSCRSSGWSTSRVHLDIETDDIPAEVARLEALGAKVARRLERWVVMEAPTGQRFCVVRIQRPGFPKTPTSWD